MKVLSLPVGQKYVDAVADVVAARVRTTPAGVSSLEHVLVIVPTAESGRRLRMALACRFRRGCVPPVVMMPSALLTATENVASSVRETGLLAQMMAGLHEGDFPALFPHLPDPRTEDWCVGMATQFVDLWRILGSNALGFADVAAVAPNLIVDENADLEIARWQDLAELERRHFDQLHQVGLVHRLESMKTALAKPALPEGIEEIFLAGADEAMPALSKFAWPIEPTDLTPGDAGLPALTRANIFPCGTAGEEANRIAIYLSRVADDEALPAVCLADAEMFPELHGAMEARGLSIHDPSRQLVVTSSLGHLVSQVLSLFRGGGYEVFSAFVRGGDVQRWLCGELGLNESRIINSIKALDELQAVHLPEKLKDVRRYATGDLKAICDCIWQRLGVSSPLIGCRNLLAEIFKDRHLVDGTPGDEEFAAAAKAVNDLFAEFAGLSRLGRLELPLFEKLFESVAYSLEPDEGNVVRTEGWLELPFLDVDEVVIAGFEEGAVPESVVGHPFLPDSLRSALGLPSNEQRAARDARILAQVCAARPHGAVKVFFHAVNAVGDILKPSRLLFLTDDDGELACRVMKYYRDKVGTEAGMVADLPENWRLNLPIPERSRTLDHISPTSLVEYLICPFAYYLKKLFGEPVDDRAEELDAARFGQLCHEALDRWSRGALRESEDASAIADELALHVEQILQEWFGIDMPAIVALQGESAKRRLVHFAAVQARRHAEGWRIVATERNLTVRYGHTEIHGRCDRIDYKPADGSWCVIDYKVYDTLSRAAWYVTDAKSVAYATEVRGLPSFTLPGGEKKTKVAVWSSVQLPIYCAMLDAANDADLAAAKLERISSCYCVMGKTADETGFTEPMTGAYVSDAEKVIAKLIEGIEAGRFWPPSPVEAWRWGFESLIFNAPETSVNAAWIADQESRT